MVRTEDQCRFDIDDRVTGDHTLVEGFSQTFDRRLDEFFGDGATSDSLIDLNTLTRVRLHLEDDMTVLTVTARLFDVLTFAVCSGLDGLTIGDLRSTDFDSDAEIIFQTGDVDIELEFTDTGDDALSSLVISVVMEGRIFLSELDQSRSHLILITFLERFNRFRDDRFCEFDRL